MKRSIVLVASAVLGATAALADSKPSADEAKKLGEAIAALGCEGGEGEKETGGSGAFEGDGTKWKFGGQWDIKFDKDFKALSLTRD